MSSKKNKFLRELLYQFNYYIGCHLAGILLRLLRATLRFRNHHPEVTAKAMQEQGKIIYVYWHQDLTSISMFGYQEIRRHRPVCVMISQSRDGNILTRALSWFDVNAVRGSSTRGGAQALKEMIAILENRGNAAIAVDGPRGPRHQVHPGIFLLAKLTGAAIVPISWKYEHAWTFRSWDRTRLARPFSRLESTFHDALIVPANATRADYERFARELKIALGDN